MGRRRGLTVALFGFWGLSATTVSAQDLQEESVSITRTVPTLQATPLVGPPPTLDGRLDDPQWSGVAVATDFVQFEPTEGAAPTERTEARVLYGPDALYVAMRALDSSPQAIVSQLARRDEEPHSDWLEVVIDSYDDRRTAFRFGVNPAGVKKDTYHFDDTNEDDSWDAVWDVATSTDDGGWTAEFRIPYSQLRFGAASEQTWGINFVRVIARHQETSVWAPLSRGESAIVSRFGRLQGL
ncbi:MAG: carbohydrate binding family 9 domain-containing protein, partial [Gemmatimonadota bacterium]|nr:carbohydrate binding family 9 domain-containing protein [Gemmatimonadota bacterium]